MGAERGGWERVREKKRGYIYGDNMACAVTAQQSRSMELLIPRFGFRRWKYWGRQEAGSDTRLTTEHEQNLNIRVSVNALRIQLRRIYITQPAQLLQPQRPQQPRHIKRSNTSNNLTPNNPIPSTSPPPPATSQSPTPSTSHVVPASSANSTPSQRSRTSESRFALPT